ncbi:MAG: SRPBCC family protein [Acidimicrobiales bacterium]|nr:SRPBCC family protein [Acidimicrobiales bacterium]
MSDGYTVSRETTIGAAPDVVFARLRDLTTWNDWSPWAAMDPNMQNTYSGATGQVGSRSAWKGNRKVGEGSMTITGLDEPNRVEIDLQFLKPFKARNDIVFSLAPNADGTDVVWAMTGKVTLMTRVMGLLGKSMDKMVGPDFEKGLASLKAVVESN